ncbi:MAG: magnesium/cobalt transporter CorA [Thermodesulfobacteriota bacterium]
MRLVKRRSEKAGLPPGEPVYVGTETGAVTVTAIEYDEKDYSIRVVDSVEECIPYKGKPSTTWINVDGLHEVRIIERLGSCFGLHPLTVEDILNTEQRPKMDMTGEYIFIVMNMLTYDDDARELDSEQVSVILGENFVLTFREKRGDIFDAVRERLKTDKGRIRKAGADYLAYSLMDTVVDNYFKVLECIGEDIEEIEDELVSNPGKETVQSIHFLRRETIYLRRSVWPLREVISRLEREETALIRPGTSVYLRDIYDHTIQVVEAGETYRDLISGMLDIYLSSISNRTNEIMKVLTIFAAIFIPLTFIAGVYGMNFNTHASPLNMPELNSRYGYPAVLTAMFAVGITMLLFFRKKNWL